MCEWFRSTEAGFLWSLFSLSYEFFDAILIVLWRVLRQHITVFHNTQ